MTITSFLLAQNAVRQFDKKHWQHAFGPVSIRHTYLHLISSVSNLVEQTNPLILHDGVRESLAGIVLEHLVRIANNANKSLEEVLVSQASADILGVSRMEELPGIWLVACARLTREKPFSTHAVPTRDLLSSLFMSLGPLARVLEAYEHEKEDTLVSQRVFSYEHRDAMRLTICQLARIAYDLSNIGDLPTDPSGRQPRDPWKPLIERYLAPLGPRLAKLDAKLSMSNMHL